MSPQAYSQGASTCPCLPPRDNSSNITTSPDFCATEIPTSKQLFSYMPSYGYIFVAVLVLFVLAIVAIYIEEIIFILKNFRNGVRRNKTIWILAFFPVFATTGLLGVLVPRSGTLVDMVSNVFFGTCLYSFGRLMVSYMGGARRMWSLIEDERKIQLNTPPCCCCCVCLPTVKFDRRRYFRITLLVMQVALVRPILMFLAAVLWTNGSYQPGDISAYNSFIYITVVNLISTMCAMYGLMLLRGVLRPELEEQFSITGKIASLQLTLICSALPNLIIGILVGTHVITCGPLFPSKGRGEAIYHSFLVLIMLPFSLLGRSFYRRAEDGMSFASVRSDKKHVAPINEHGTDDEGEFHQEDKNLHDPTQVETIMLTQPRSIKDADA